MTHNPSITVVPANTGERFNSVGNVYRMIIDSAKSEGRYALMEAYIPPGKGGPFHVHHREDEVFVITEGCITFFGDHHETFQATPGAVVACPPGAMRGFRNDTQTLAKMMIFYSKAGIDEMIKMDGELVANDIESIQQEGKPSASCPQLSAHFGIDDIDIPLPEKI